MSMDFAPVIDAVKSTRPIIFDKALSSSVKMKGEADFVTEVDLRISEHLKRQLGALHPEIGFMSEEEEPGELARRRWILDPIRRHHEPGVRLQHVVGVAGAGGRRTPRVRRGVQPLR